MPRHKEFDYDDKLMIARNLFWKKGYNATSLNDLIDAMKINRSSLYLTYGSKHELFLKCLKNYIQDKEKEYQKSVEKGETPLKSVANLVRAITLTVLQDSKTCLSANSTFELARTDIEVKKILEKQALTSVKLIEELLIKVKKSGELKSDKDPLILVHFIVSGIASIWSTHLLFSDEKLTRQTAEFLIDTITQ
ncbi:TetR/AcrR family transcriptional regulator [Empedobacter falsenii]|uniref:TetR/AcrR family transcriptional regulator n=1 Tax=Empedobacter sp. GD03797 TaxID=2975382 RepID=UPI00244A0D77|nr:TetR/AcrR family transcriptional regulator [Empedobacter sp. GD03797]MDH1884053.1 TetR/AcrR family transcriptional regulator [Empedobacter sp. GD03797]